MRDEPYVPARLAEDFDGRLPVATGAAGEHGRDNVAALGVGLAVNDHPVAVGDRRTDHGVAGDLEHDEAVAVTDEHPRQGDNVLEELVRENGRARGDPPHERDLSHAFRQFPGLRRSAVLAGESKGHGSRPPSLADQVPLLLQYRQLVRDAGCARESYRVSDLPHAR